MSKKEIEKEFEEILKKKFMCPTTFSTEIEKIVKEQKMSYIESICYFCEMNEFDVEAITKLISKPLKEKIKGEAVALNFLKKTTRAKPLM